MVFGRVVVVVDREEGDRRWLEGSVAREVAGLSRQRIHTKSRGEQHFIYSEEMFGTQDESGHYTE